MKKLLKHTCLVLLIISASQNLNAQNIDSLQIKKMYDNALTTDIAYKQLEKLCKEAPARLIGTPNSFKAIDLMKDYLEGMGFDTVFLQEFSSPAWIHHSTEAFLNVDGKTTKLNVVALGPSGATPKGGIEAEVIEVMGIDELKALGKENVEGKIVFYNRAMKATHYNVFTAYSETVDQRYYGPLEAMRMGAVASITRSITYNMTDYSHTGSCYLREEKIPAIAISTNDAEKLSKALKMEKKLSIKLNVNVEDIETTTYNVIADIKGTEKPDEYIIVAGHLDAWHNGEGAQDDGVGCLQSAEVLRLFKETGIKPKRSIRAILYMDEEIFQSGGNAYLEYSKENNIKNYFAMESDGGGYTPRGFMLDTSDEMIENVQAYQHLFEPYGIHYIMKGFGGVDIRPLKEIGVPTSGYRCDWHRYYDMHHCEYDTFEIVNFREMQLGSAAMSSFIYLMDKYGLAD